MATFHIVVGTRPEIIKLAPVIKLCQKRKIPFKLVHSNQHYSHSLDQIFFKQLELPEPDFNLNAGSGSHIEQIAKIMTGLETIINEDKPDVTIVQGDTNTVLGAALTSCKMGVKIAHVEAGLRSYEAKMPEETNRIMTDHISDYLFSVTDVQSRILTNEGISADKVFCVGNTIVDSTLQNKDPALKISTLHKDLKLTDKDFYLFTAHRGSNVDSAESLHEVVELLKMLKKKVVWPIHHRAAKNLKSFSIDLPAHVIPIEPVGYFDFLNLLQRCIAVVTDSGGVQEEACILKTPCITIRERTERPETVDVCGNILVGRDKEKFSATIAELPVPKGNPFGDGKSSEKILDILTK